MLGHAIDVLAAARATMGHVGDSRTNVESARSTGVAAWAVPYGYGEPIESAQPDRVFPDLGAIAPFVLA